ncbi:MAG: PIN domain-containing protein, partial [Candidatus Bathyarchaeia archaeon]
MGEVIVPDTSILIEGRISSLLGQDKVGAVKVVIPKAALDELQAQASKGIESGWTGLDELIRIRKVCQEKNIEITFMGERPSIEDIQLANTGRIDSLIIEAAKGVKGTLYTADHVQARVAEAEGVAVHLVRSKKRKRRLGFEDFFTPDTLSLQ